MRYLTRLGMVFVMVGCGVEAGHAPPESQDGDPLKVIQPAAGAPSVGPRIHLDAPDAEVSPDGALEPLLDAGHAGATAGSGGATGGAGGAFEPQDAGAAEADAGPLEALDAAAPFSFPEVLVGRWRYHHRSLLDCAGEPRELPDGGDGWGPWSVSALRIDGTYEAVFESDTSRVVWEPGVFEGDVWHPVSTDFAWREMEIRATDADRLNGTVVIADSVCEPGLLELELLRLVP